MASIRSLGLASPSALHYALSEGILPSEPSPKLYRWYRCVDDTGSETAAGEELLLTDYYVIWSRAGIVQRSFNFTFEGEKIRHATFARFPNFKSAPSSADLPSGSPGDALDPSHASPGLKVKKQRRGASENDAAPSDRTGEARLSAENESGDQSSETLERALIVVLKSQAHIFFLAGTSHVISLPFEVEFVFTLPCGVVLQRHVPKDSVGTAKSPLMPSTPANSFAFSQMTSSLYKRASQSSESTAEAKPGYVKDPALSFLSLLPSQKYRRPRPDPPSHMYLRDPLVEPGLIFEKEVPGHGDGNGQGNLKTSRLGPKEEILYLSRENELRAIASPNKAAREALIAVTVNRVSGQYTVWDVRDNIGKESHSRSPRTARHSSGTRRKSARLPATSTNTPGGRNISGMRESFGGRLEPIVSQEAVEDGPDLAAQLDPAFENPGAPARSSRRISSMMARSDLSFHRDPSGYTDPTVGPSTKRGPSFGPRPSLDGVFGRSHPHRRRADPLSPELISSGISNVSIEGAQDNSKSDEDSDEKSATLRWSADSLQTTLTFRKIREFTPGDAASGAFDPTRLEPGPRVFTMKSPQNDPSLAQEFILCILERGQQRMSVLYIKANITRQAGHSKKRTGVRLQVSQMHNGSGIIDACKIQDPAGHARLLVLLSSAPEVVELTLQSPWTTQLGLKTPERLLVRHPYAMDQSAPFKSKREGGLKRILSVGIDALQAVEPCSSLGEFDALDTKGTWHRFHVQLSPQSSFISKALTVCECVLPRTPTEREPILRAWQDVSAWVHSRSGATYQDEWFTFVITLSLLFVPYLGEEQKPTAPTRRRKTGLLRSSSGANVNQEALKAMLASEDISGSAHSTWLQDTSWSWVTNPDLMGSPSSKPSRASAEPKAPDDPFSARPSFFRECLALAREFLSSETGKAVSGKAGYLLLSLGKTAEEQASSLCKVLVALHLFCEEQKLDVLAADNVHSLSPLLAQMAVWLGWTEWLTEGSSCYMVSSTHMERWSFDENSVQIRGLNRPDREPPSIMAFVAASYQGRAMQPFPTLLDLKQSPTANPDDVQAVAALTPRTRLLFALLQIKDLPPLDYVRRIYDIGYDTTVIDTLPEAVAAPLRSKMAACQAEPGTSLPRGILETIDRNDIALLDQQSEISKAHTRMAEFASHDSARDHRSISSTALDVESPGAYDIQAEMDRTTVTRLVFKEDQRFMEASLLLHPLRTAVARCDPLPDWSEADLLEAQQELVKMVAIRTLAVSPGRGMLYYCGRHPLLTEKFPIHGFSLSCLMKPTTTTVTADRAVYTEEKVSWAFFHAGVEAGLSISKSAKGVDTSWITFNKPTELNNRHAGFLLALGLNGHLKHIAKWVAFKYLTPKHTMTSIGLLLGLAASYVGTMDPLITRLLSVHVTRMLPPGAAELNLSPLTQTTGIMSIGLLYCDTQHRRMSEVMISEMENIEHDDSVSPLENLRDEGYRLATGFALGYINLGRGKTLKGLHDMHIVERLLSLAVATKKVELVHILDKATAGATVAIALIFMKTEDRALAKKIDVPDTIHQFDYVRPDIFLLRTVARHLIMWSEMTPTMAWMEKQLPAAYRPRYKLNNTYALRSVDLPLFNIVAGLCLALGLRFAGSARADVRNLLGHYLDQLMRIVRLPAPTYDARLARITARNCQDAVALAAAAVMAGTGDVWLLRRLRRLHGRTDAATPYGSHLAAHLALGALFLGGGTHTFATTDRAVASLLAAFYPLFPAQVLDNAAHLQAFRHLWALAAEPRCLVVRAADAHHRPLAAPVTITLRTGETLAATAPCLLPPLAAVAAVRAADPTLWPAALDLAGNPTHAAAFRRHQSLFVRRRGPAEAAAAAAASGSAFSATMRALNARAARQPWDWVFALPALAGLNRAMCARALPPDVVGASGGVALQATGRTGRASPADDRLALAPGALLEGGRAERLWSLRGLFAWLDGLRGRGEEEEAAGAGWLGREALEELRAQVALRGRAGRGSGGG